MKNLFILGMVLLSANAFAGNEKGNGGGIHFCTNQKNLELYDIYEAQARYGYAIKESSLPVEVQVAKALEKIKKNNSYIGKLVESKISYLKAGHMIVRSKVKLSPIGGTTILLVDEGCSYKQLANWDDVSGNLIVNKDLYDRMSNTNKAALYIHETLYKVGRDLDLLTREDNGTSKSDEIRRMVGEIFSEHDKLEQMWTVVDPQIAINKSTAEMKTIRGRINGSETSCKNQTKVYNEALNVSNEKMCGADIQSYMKTYYDTINECQNSEAELHPEVRELNDNLLSYDRVVINEEASKAYLELNRINRRLTDMHDRFMTNIMKCK